jgi:putative transposase
VRRVRRGLSARAAARSFGVSLSVVQYWLRRAAGLRLDRVDWQDRSLQGQAPANRTPNSLEDRILEIRKSLRETSDLGEHGPAAIQAELLRLGTTPIPALRTIARILDRRGALDGRRRQRRPAPPRGWYLPRPESRTRRCAGTAPAKAKKPVELDSVDIIEDLVIKGGQDVNVLTAISLHGGLCEAWPERQITAKFVVSALIDHWRSQGLPRYAKFDNDTVFQGPHQHADTFGRVTRLCLSLGVTPIFAPPRETGFQADIESFNGRWQRGVWHRFTFADLSHVQDQSKKFIAAARAKRAPRIESAPKRRPFPRQWRLDLQKPLQGAVLFLRRTNARGEIEILGRTYLASPTWSNRLVRAEVDLTEGRIRIYSLRRREPHRHTLLKTHRYKLPVRRFAE